MRILKEYKKPTTIVMTGEWVVDHKDSVSYTDDECTIDVRKYNGDIETITAFGGLTILTEDEFYEFIQSNHYKMHCDDDFNKEEHMYIIIKDFVGTIGATVELRGGPAVEWDVDEFVNHQFDGFVELFVEVLGDYEFESMPIGKAIEFLESDKGSKVTDILSEETKNQLFGEIDNQGFGYWIQNYGYKGDEDDELVVLCKKAKRMMNKVQDRLRDLGVEI